VEESLRKRLARCEAKTGEKGSAKVKKRGDVAAYSIRRESRSFEPMFQLRLKPSIRDLEIVGESARCLLVSKELSTLVDVDLKTGAEVRRVENLPLLGDTSFAPDGHGIGIRRTAAVGQGPTLLSFLDPEGRVTAKSSIPDATSEIALGPDLWYVGCRNGFLYGFGFDGRQRWAWETPGSEGHHENAYFRPCPYYVAARRSFAATASMENIYGVGSNGTTMWHAALPNELQTRWSYTIPLEGDQGEREAYGILELSADASREEVKSAYWHLALATHPDRNPNDPDASAKFRRVQGAYERILTGAPASVSAGAGININVEIHGIGPTASFLAANTGGVAVGSSEGRLYLFDANGRLRDSRVLGDGPVRAALRPDGTVGAAWCGDALLFFKANRIVNAAEALEWPEALTMFGDDVVLWRRNQVQVMDAYGRLMWSVEFSKNVTGVSAHGDTLVCAAGVLAAFRRTDV
jgi:DnaJ domain